jgi:hypothetical protein
VKAGALTFWSAGPGLTKAAALRHPASAHMFSCQAGANINTATAAEEDGSAPARLFLSNILTHSVLHASTVMEKYLREWRQEALNRHQHDTAIFVADKLLALTSMSPGAAPRPHADCPP